MILGKDLNWYFKIIQSVLLIVAGWVIFTGLMGKIPLIGWFFSLMVLPITWILKLGGALYVGYQTVKKYQGTMMQALVSGGLIGAGVGLASMAISLLKMMFKLRIATMVFGTYGLFMAIISETITGLVLGVIGGILAGSPEKK